VLVDVDLKISYALTCVGIWDGMEPTSFGGSSGMGLNNQLHCCFGRACNVVIVSLVRTDDPRPRMNIW